VRRWPGRIIASEETPVGVEPTWTGLQPVAVPSGSSVTPLQCPRQESNPAFDFRRVACVCPPHSEDSRTFNAPPRNWTSSCSLGNCRAVRHTRRATASRPGIEPGPGPSEGPMRSVTPSRRIHRADDWICTSMMRFTKPPPRYSATSASRSAGSRTPCDGFGDRLLSQEHTPPSAPGLATGGFSA
jgi:hypothetical protein